MKTKRLLIMPLFLFNSFALKCQLEKYSSTPSLSISDTFRIENGYTCSFFFQYSIPILLSLSALVSSINNYSIVPERMKTGTVILH